MPTDTPPVDDFPAAAPSNGARVPRVNGRNPPAPNATSAREARQAPSAPSPVEEPGKASQATRNVSAEVHKALIANDAERMAAARILGGELGVVIRDAVETMLSVQGMVIDPAKLDAILAEKVTAGVKVVKVKHGMAVRPRKLPRAVAIAYGIGGGIASAYERLAAIQVSWPAMFAVVSSIVHVYGIAAATVKASAVKTTPEPTQDAPSMVDVRHIAEDGRE